MDNLERVLHEHGYDEKVNIQKLFVVLSAIGFKILEPVDMQAYERNAESVVDYKFAEGEFLGKIIDTETTGLADDDEIYEIGITLFRYSDTEIEFLSTVEMFEEPTKPIDTDNTIITGRTIEDVRGKRFDEALIQEIFSTPGIVIAHNASFDRPKLEKRFGIFSRCAWACSQKDIDWLRTFKQVDTKLRLLVEDRVGKCYHGHHAKDDTVATFELLREQSPEGHTYFHHLLQFAKQQTLRIFAVDTPFAKKDVLRRRGYAWNDACRMYARDIACNAYVDEHSWLDDNVYGYSTHDLEVPTTPVTARTRHSQRIVPPENFLHHTIPWNPKRGQRIAAVAKTDAKFLHWALSNIHDMPESLRRTLNFWLNTQD